jgi:hypothetical protein
VEWTRQKPEIEKGFVSWGTTVGIQGYGLKDAGRILGRYNWGR